MSDSITKIVFIEVKRLEEPCVILTGPSDWVNRIDRRIFEKSNNVTFTKSSLGNCTEIRSTGQRYADNSTFMKASLLTEVLKWGFKPMSNVTDDFLALSRESFAF